MRGEATLWAWHPLASLLLAAVAIMGSPGPSTISATAMGAAFGLRRSAPYVGGLVIGTTAVLMAVTAGVTAVVLAVPGAARALVAVSAVYILYLAFRIATAPPLSGHDETIRAPAFGGGFLLAIGNPKAWLAIAAVFAGSTIPAPAKVAVLAAMIVLIHAFWLLAGTTLTRALRHPRISRIVNAALAAALVAATLAAVAAG